MIEINDETAASNLLIQLSMDMFNRKYKIRDDKSERVLDKKNIHPRDIRFYNKRMLHLFKSLLIKKQSSNKKECEDDDYMNNIPSEITELGDMFITQCILFFKQVDKNEIIQEELIESIQDIPSINCYDEYKKETIDDGISEYDKHFYKSSASKNIGVFEIETENQDCEDCKMIPLKRDYHLRDNRFRLKGISKNNNMAILYEQDETTG